MSMNKYGVEYICPQCNSKMECWMRKEADGTVWEDHECLNPDCRLFTTHTNVGRDDQDQSGSGSDSPTSGTGR